MSSVPPGEILRSATFRRAFGYFFLIWLILVLLCGWIGYKAIEALEPEDDVHESTSEVFDWTVEVEEDWLRDIREDFDAAEASDADEDPWASLPEEMDEDDLGLSEITFRTLWRDSGASVLHIAEESEEDVCWRIEHGASEELGNLAPEVTFEGVPGNDEMVQSTVRENPLSEDEDFEPSVDSEQWLASDDPEEDQICLARRWSFEGGGVLTLGHVVDREEPEVSLAWLVRFAAPWAVLALLVGFLGAFRLARASITLVSDLERVRRHVAEGQLSTRLRRRDHGGDLDAAATAINDVLDRLDQAVSMLSEVTDNIAHDLRTPLTRLQGQLDLVRRSESPTPEMIEAVQEEAGQLLATFNALMRIAQVESGSRRKGFRTFDLTPLVTDVGDFYGPAMAEKPLAFSCHVPPEPVEVHGDPDLWMQALSNLLDNAMKYTPAHGRVYLELRPGDPRSGVPVQIRLRDSGSGIPEHELDKVFQRFYRLSLHRKQKGSGLGLSLVAAICELHRAEIHLENQNGLMVLITIPPRP